MCNVLLFAFYLSEIKVFFTKSYDDMDCVCYYLQVASVFVYRIHHNYVFPRYIDGLAACLIKHLDLDLEDVNFAVYRQNQKAVS